MKTKTVRVTHEAAVLLRKIAKLTGISQVNIASASIVEKAQKIQNK
jgi:hypothetical protein